jgi:hypothetical protein
VIGEVKEIKISSLKSLTVASLPLAYKEILESPLLMHPSGF